MFWTMILPEFFKGKRRKEKFFLLLRQYEEEILDAFLQDDDYYSELLHYWMKSCVMNSWTTSISILIRLSVGR